MFSFQIFSISKGTVFYGIFIQLVSVEIDYDNNNNDDDSTNHIV